MKVLGVLLALAVAAQAVPVELNDDVEARNIIINAIIDRAIDHARDIIFNGHDGIGIPIIDPMRVFATDLKFPGQLLNFDISLAGAEMNGIGDFKTDIDFRMLTMTMRYDIVIEKIEIKAAHYNLTGLLAGVVPFYGNGRADFELINLRMVGSALMGFDGTTLVMREIRDATFSLDKMNANTSGYIGGGDIDNVINALLEDLVAEYISRFSPSISNWITPHVVTGCNMLFDAIRA